MRLEPLVFDTMGLTLTRPDARGLLSRLSLLYAHASAKTAAALPMRDED